MSIEIFFKGIKSYLKIERFVGKNLNVVANLRFAYVRTNLRFLSTALIQIFSTLLAYALIALLKAFYKMGILEIKRSLKYGVDSYHVSVPIAYSSSNV